MAWRSEFTSSEPSWWISMSACSSRAPSSSDGAEARDHTPSAEANLKQVCLVNNDSNKPRPLTQCCCGEA